MAANSVTGSTARSVRSVTIRAVIRARRALHVVTACACAAGVAVALYTPSSPDAPASARASAVRPHADARPELAIESFEPADTPDTFDIKPVAPRLVPPNITLPASSAPTREATTSGSAPVAAPAPTTRAPAAPGQLVARLTTKTVYVYARPGDAQPVAALFSTTEFDNPRVLPVRQRGGDWLRVALPTRPNGSEGWIRARDATLDTVADKVVVDLAARTLTWTRNGEVQLHATVAIGAPASPTPTGSFFVTDVLPSSGAYGDWVVALDAHSDTFTEFEGGDARIAIHGTNDPSSIGRAASSGCVRADAETLATLAAALPAGTPVDVV